MDKHSNDSKNNQRNGPPGRIQYKQFLIWGLILIAIFGLMSVGGHKTGKPQEWNISQVIAALEEGRIADLTLRADAESGPDYYRIEGKLKPEASVESSAALSGETVDAQPAKTYVARGRLTDSKMDSIRDLARKQGITYKEPPASPYLSYFLFTFLPIIIFVALIYFIFIRQIRMAGKGAMSFGKSKARMLTRDHDRVTFKDVAGCDEAKEDVAEIVDFLKDPKKYHKIGGRVPKGILMVGPPGTGKTLLGKAVAGEAEVPFFSISGSDFVEMFVGVGAARVRDMFEQGRKHAPCIIFIDEIDAVGRQRGAGLGGGNDEREQTLNSLLVEMDGFDAREGVIIIAATNRPDVLDNALLRPGRFDRQISVDLPDMNGREDILKVHAKKIQLKDDVDLGVVARNTPGFSGADLENLLNEGALIAARRDHDKVGMVHLNDAREKIAFGAERRKLMDDEDKRMTAFHEAGHALVQAIIDDGTYPLHKVSIIPRGRALGMTMMMPKKDILGMSRSQLYNQICMAMAGRIGEEMETGDFSNGASGDIKQATRIARHMVCDWGMSDLGPVALGENQDHIFLGKEITRNQNYSEETARRIDAEIHRIIDAQYARAQEIISEHREALKSIALALLKHETIEGKHVHEILEHGKIQSNVETMQNQPKAKEDAEADKQAEEKANTQTDESVDPESSAEGAPA